MVPWNLPGRTWARRSSLGKPPGRGAGGWPLGTDRGGELGLWPAVPGCQKLGYHAGQATTLSPGLGYPVVSELAAGNLDCQVCRNLLFWGG